MREVFGTVPVGPGAQHIWLHGPFLGRVFPTENSVQPENTEFTTIRRQESIPSRVPISTACPRTPTSHLNLSGNTSNFSSSKRLTEGVKLTRH
jgi:hypothetical protein